MDTQKRKPGRPATGHKIAGTDQRFHREYPGQEPRVIEHHGPDAIMEDVETPATNHKYPPPKAHPVFQKIWLETIDNIMARENFKANHLHTLEVLCDLYVEYDELTKFIQVRSNACLQNCQPRELTPKEFVERMTA